MTTQSSEPPPPRFTNLRLQEIRLNGIQLGGLKSRSHVFLELAVDDEQTQATEAKPFRAELVWEQVFEFALQHSSTFTIDVLRRRSLLSRKLALGDARGLVGGLRLQLGDLLEQENPSAHRTLGRQLRKDNVLVPGTLNLNFFVQTVEDSALPTKMEIRIATDQVKTADDRLARLDRPGDLSRPFATTSNIVDGFLSLEATTQSAYSKAVNLGEWISPLGDAIGYLDQVLKTLEGVTSVHPYLATAFNILTAGYKALKQQAEQDDNVRDLAVTMRDTLAFAREASELRKIEGTSDVVKDMADAVKECADVIQEYTSSSFLVRAAKSTVSSNMATRIKTCNSNFAKLKEKFLLTLDIRIWKNTDELLKEFRESDRRTRLARERELLNGLPLVPAAYNSDVENYALCTEGTREHAMAAIFKWIESDEEEQARIFWLSGQAGTGKSTLARSVCAKLEEHHRLGASFFFVRAMAHRKDPEKVLSTLARQLAEFNSSVAHALVEVLKEKEPAEIVAMPPRNQFQRLISSPLKAALQGADPTAPIVVVLDALDECGTAGSRSSLLGAIEAEVPKLSPSVKFLITSRRESDISAMFRRMGTCVQDHVVGIAEKDIDRDIGLVLDERLSRVVAGFDDLLDDSWPGKETKDALVRQAAGLFVWVRTACDFIGDKEILDPEGQLKMVLDSNPNRDEPSPWTGLDYLYQQILKQAYERSSFPRLVSMFKSVIGAIVTIKVRVTPSALGSLLAQSPPSDPATRTKEVNLLLLKLHSVLAIDPASKGVIRVIHASFPDFLTNQDRCKDDRFFVDAATRNLHLTRCCLGLITGSFKSCGLDPSLLNQGEPGNPVLLDEHVPEELQYAFRFWAEHLSESPADDEIYQQVRSLFLEHLPQWLAVLEFLSALQVALPSISTARSWLGNKAGKPEEEAKELLQLLNDPNRFESLADSLMSRYRRLRQMDDLDASISNVKQAVDLTPDGHSDRPGRLNNLGNLLRMRFGRLGDTADLDASIWNLQQAVDLTPDGHSDRPGRLNNLGNLLRMRFGRLGDTIDLDASIWNLQQAVDLTPHGHSDRPMYLNNLGDLFLTRFGRLGDMDDLEASISNIKQAVDLTPDGHPDRPAHLHSLGNSLQHRFRVTKAIDDLEQSLRVFNEAASSRAGPPAVAFEAALHWANLAREQGRSQSALDGYSAAVRLLPRVAWLDLDAESRQAALLKWSGNLARDAASYAIGQSQLEQAVEFLDEGRSVIWAQAFALRTGLDELRVDHPELADRLERVGRQLDRGAFVDWHLVRDVTRSEGQGQQESLEQVAQHHRRLASEWDELVERVRGLAGFEHFLRPLPFAHLRRAAEGGPVVIVNVSERQVDALIIRAERDVERVPLPGVDAKTISAYAKNLAFDLTDEVVRKYVLAPALRSIWESIVVPILNALGVSTDGPVDKTQPKPHIWWCPTGPLTFIPLHAAGPCANGQPDLTERVISSYTTTLSALLRARDSHVRVTGGPDRLLIVGQDPGEDKPWNALPKLAKEVALVESLAKKAMADEDVETLRQGKATVDNVLKAMGECTWVHLSCHGHQDAKKPMDSAFILHEGRRLRLSDIATQRLQHSDFAFLSACHTAVGATELSDESIHLAAALQCAGFRSVG